MNKKKKKTLRWYDLAVEKYPSVSPETAKGFWHWLLDTICWKKAAKCNDFTSDAFLQQVLDSKVKFKTLLFKYRCYRLWCKVFDDSWLDKLYLWLRFKWERNIKDPIFHRKMKKQRAKRGFSDEDWWNLDNYITTTLPQLFDALADNTHSTPGCVLELMKAADPRKYRKLKFPKSDAKEAKFWKMAHKWWVNRLHEIAFCLREANEKTCSVQNEEQYIDKTHFEPCKDDPYMSEMVNDCTEEESAQNNKHYMREKELDEYRKQQWEKAMLMISQLYGCLWD